MYTLYLYFFCSIALNSAILQYCLTKKYYRFILQITVGIIDLPQKAKPMYVNNYTPLLSFSFPFISRLLFHSFVLLAFDLLRRLPWYRPRFFGSLHYICIHALHSSPTSFDVSAQQSLVQSCPKHPRVITVIYNFTLVVVTQKITNGCGLSKN